MTVDQISLLILSHKIKTGSVELQTPLQDMAWLEMRGLIEVNQKEGSYTATPFGEAIIKELCKVGEKG